ncbi:MAG: glycosyltransferase family 2 protein [Lachnospiraceae bacterium]|nr:glycosyltransferase family 2 protein [Lachnospiraceae bacterium]
MKDFSVIVLCYNSNKAAMEKTLDSIICQKGVDLEIVFADDASANDCLKEATDYLDSKGFAGYKVCAHKENVGTVKNISDALSYAEGKYLKCIGAGDMLFSEDTLAKVKKHLRDEKSAMCFGKMQAYYMEDDKVKFMTLTVPQDIKAHIDGNVKRVKMNTIVHHGWIAGASMFYVTEVFKNYLQDIVGTVRYCEDLLQVNLLLAGERITCLNKAVMYYEYGSGISTNAGNGNSSRMKKDHDKYWKMMENDFRGNKLIKKGKVMHQLMYIEDLKKRLINIMFKNPGYFFMSMRTKRQKKVYEIKEKGMLQ